MLSKNNFKERLRKMEPRKERFSIRKFSVGAASVLIGFFFMGMGQGQTVRAADTTQDVKVEQPSSTNTADAKSEVATDSKASDATSTDATKVDSVTADANEVATTGTTDVHVEKPESELPESNVKASQVEQGDKQSSTEQAQNVATPDSKQSVKAPSEENRGGSTPTNGQSNVDSVKSETQAKAQTAGDATPNENADKNSSVKVTSPAQPAVKDNATKVAVNKDTKTDQTKVDANKQIQLDAKTGIPTLTDAQIKEQVNDIENKLEAGTLSEDAAAKATEDLNSKLTPEQRARLSIMTFGAEPENAQTVSDWSSFISALEDANVSTINLGGKITVNGKTGSLGGQSLGYNGCLTLTKQNIARTLTINGNGNIIDFGHYSLMLEDNNQKNGAAWNITFNKVTMKGVSKDGSSNTSATEPGTFGLISLADVSGDNQKKITINLNDVTADVTGRPIISGAKANKTSEHYTLNLSGNNSFTNEGYAGGLTPADDGSALEAGIVNVTGGTTTINMTKTSGYNLQYGGNAIRTAENGTSVTIAEGAALSIIGGKDVRGIFTGNGIDSTVEVNGTLNENMGDGHSMGIFTGNLNVGEKGTVYIQTKQDNNGVDGWGGTANFNSHHYAPISIGVGNASNVANAKTSTLNIASGGTVRIIRSATGNTTESPLISFGSGASGNMPTDQGHFILNVNQGATLDLQDAAQYKASEGAKHRSGLISMWGEGSYITGDEIHITNPKLLNLQRTGAQTGNLIRLEAKNNHVYITGTTPVAQWDTANTTSDPSFAWSVKDLTTQNAFGDFSIKGYVPAGKTEWTGSNPKTTLLDSNAILTMGANQAGKDSYKYENGTSLTGTPTDGGEKGVDYVSPYYNQILNHFNWWTSQRIAMGSDLLPSYNDAQKYAPEAKEIDTTTDHKLGDKGVTVQDGIKDVLDQNGNVSSEGYSEIDWNKSHWANSSDEAEYNKQFGTTTMPRNPEGNLKTTDTSALATIVYKDNSVDFVTVPLKVTEPTIADKQTPDGGTITVPEGHTLDNTDAANAITNKDQLKDSGGNSVVKSEGGYTWKTAPDTTIPGTKSGVVTVTYTDGSKDDVPVTVNVQSLADKYDPKGQDIHTDQGTVPGAEQGISNKGDLPSDTTYTWSTTPDVSKPGTVPGVVKVTYSDGSEDQVPINVIVGNPSTSTTKTDADKNDPQSQNIKTIIGTVPDADQGISNKDALPSGTTYTWSQTPNVYSKGDHPAVVKVTYPDSSIDYVPTTVTVTNEPTGKNITTDPNHVPDATTSIDWGKQGNTPINKPSDTTITWVTQPDVSKPGDTTGTAKITYPDGETTTVVVPIHVTDPGSTNTAFDPYGTTIRVPYGHVLDGTDAQNGIAGGVPTNATDVTYTWKYAPTTNVPNVANTTQQGYVTVKGKLDGKSVSKDVIVYVRVGDQAENYDPKGQNITVRKGAPVPEAKDGVANTSDLPSDAQYEWGFAPDTNVVGTQSTLVKVTYSDGSFDYVPQNVKVIDTTQDSVKYPVTYDPIDISRPTTNTPASKSELPKTTEGMPEGTINGYTQGTYTAPNGVTTSIDSSTGNVTVNVTKDATRGTFNVPVNVSYEDGSKATVYVPVSITGEDIDPNGDHTYYGNQSQTIMKAVPTDVHKTSDDFTPDATKSGFNEIIYNYDWDGTSGNGNYRKHTTYKLSADGTKFVNVDNASDSFDASKISYTWMNGYTPNTNFGSQTETLKAKKDDGSFNPAEQTGAGDNLPGNSKYRVNVTISDTSITAKLGLGFRPYSSWNNVYFNFYGATTGNPLTFKQNSDISDLTQDQYQQLIDVTDLGANGWNGKDINPNAPQVLAYVPGTDETKTFAMTWAPGKQPSTATVANGVGGIVRIHFNDGTYLDVPATINVVKDNDAGKPDTDKTSFNQKISYQYNGQEVSNYVIPDIAKGSTLTAAQLADYINNNLPANYSIADGYTFPGAETINSTPKTIIVPLKLTSPLPDDPQHNATVGIKYVDATDPAHLQPLQTKDGKPQIDFKFNKNDGLKADVLKTAIDSNIPTNWKLAPGFTYPGDQTDNATITVPLVHATKDINPDDPGVNPKDNKYKDLFTTATRKIYQTQPGQTSAQLIKTQTVQFGRSGVEDLVTGVVTGTGNWEVGKIQNNKFVAGGSSDFDEFAAPQITGYDSYVDGKKATSVSSKSALVSGQPTDAPDVHITYLEIGTTTPVPYDPTSDKMNETITRTITVYKTDGTTQTISQTVHFVRGGEGQDAGTKDKDGNIAWKPWTVAGKNNNRSTGETTGTWAEYDVPSVTGYDSTVDGQPATKVDEVTVTPEMKDVNVKVAYTHTIKPDDPDINPNNPGENSDMYAHPTRTINVHKPDGTTDVNKQVVWFGRTKTVSTDPNVKPVYGDWQLGNVEGNKFVIDSSAPSQWGEFTAPTITGYTANPSKVDAQTVTADTPDATVNITYSKDGGDNTNPGGGDHGGDKPQNPGDDNKPQNPGDNTKPDDNKTPDDNNKTPDNGGKKKNHAKKHARKSKAKNTKHGKTSKGYNTNSGIHGESGNTGVHGQRGNGNGQNVAPQHETMNTPAKSANNTNGANSTKAKAQTLPQTGTTDNKVGLIGLAIAAIGGLFGLAAGKKRKEDE